MSEMVSRFVFDDNDQTFAARDDGWSARHAYYPDAPAGQALGAVVFVLWTPYGRDGLLEAPDSKRKTRDGGLRWNVCAAHFNLRTRNALNRFCQLDTRRKSRCLFDPTVDKASMHRRDASGGGRPAGSNGP